MDILNTVLDTFATYFDDSAYNLVYLSRAILIGLCTLDLMIMGLSWILARSAKLGDALNKVIIFTILSMVFQGAVFDATRHLLLSVATKASMAPLFAVSGQYPNRNTRNYQIFLNTPDIQQGIENSEIANVLTKNLAAEIKQIQGTANTWAKLQKMGGADPADLQKIQDAAQSEINEYKLKHGLVSRNGYINPAAIFEISWGTLEQLNAAPVAGDPISAMGDRLKYFFVWLICTLAVVFILGIYINSIVKFYVVTTFSIPLMALGVLKPLRSFTERAVGGIITATVNYMVTIGLTFVFIAFLYSCLNSSGPFTGTSKDIFTMIIVFVLFAILLWNLPQLSQEIASGALTLGGGITPQHTAAGLGAGAQSTANNTVQGAGAVARGIGAGSASHAQAGGGSKGARAFASSFGKSLARSAGNKVKDTAAELTHSVMGNKQGPRHGTHGGSEAPQGGQPGGGFQGSQQGSGTRRADTLREQVHDKGIRGFIQSSFQQGVSDIANAEGKSTSSNESEKTTDEPSPAKSGRSDSKKSNDETQPSLPFPTGDSIVNMIKNNDSSKA